MKGRRIRMDCSVAALSRRSYIEETEARLAEVRQKLTALEVRVFDALAAREAAVASHLADVTVQLGGFAANIEQGIARLKDTGDDEWSNAKEAVDGAWEDLSGTTRRLMSWTANHEDRINAYECEISEYIRGVVRGKVEFPKSRS